MEESTLDSNLDNESIENYGRQIDLPGASTALTCGIIALPFSLGIIGIILSIISITNGNKAINAYKLAPGKYTLKSFKRANAGRTCGIISLSLFGLGLLILIAFVAGS